jgi:hypothetical protein
LWSFQALAVLLLLPVRVVCNLVNTWWMEGIESPGAAIMCVVAIVVFVSEFILCCAGLKKALKAGILE